MVKHRQPAWSPPQRIQGGATRKSLGVQTRHDLGKYRAGRWHLPSYQKAKSKSLTPPNAANTLLSLDTALLPTTLNWTAVSQTNLLPCASACCLGGSAGAPAKSALFIRLACFMRRWRGQNSTVGTGEVRRA